MGSSSTSGAQWELGKTAKKARKQAATPPPEAQPAGGPDVDVSPPAAKPDSPRRGPETATVADAAKAFDALGLRVQVGGELSAAGESVGEEASTGAAPAPAPAPTPAASPAQRRPPQPHSPKKRKAASSAGGGPAAQEDKLKRGAEAAADVGRARGGALLGDLLAEFDQIELNRDLLDAIRRTESHTSGPGGGRGGGAGGGRGLGGGAAQGAAIFEAAVAAATRVLESRLAAAAAAAGSEGAGGGGAAGAGFLRAYALRAMAAFTGREGPGSSADDSDSDSGDGAEEEEEEEEEDEGDGGAGGGSAQGRRSSACGRQRAAPAANGSGSPRRSGGAGGPAPQTSGGLSVSMVVDASQLELLERCTSTMGLEEARAGGGSDGAAAMQTPREQQGAGGAAAAVPPAEMDEAPGPGSPGHVALHPEGGGLPAPPPPAQPAAASPPQADKGHPGPFDPGARGSPGSLPVAEPAGAGAPGSGPAREKREQRRALSSASGDNSSRLSNDPPKRQRMGPPSSPAGRASAVPVAKDTATSRPAGVAPLPAPAHQGRPSPQEHDAAQASEGGGGAGILERTASGAEVEQAAAGGSGGDGAAQRRQSRSDAVAEEAAAASGSANGAAGHGRRAAGPAWGSTLVCADLTVNDVASSYWPFLRGASAAATAQPEEEAFAVDDADVQGLVGALGEAIAGVYAAAGAGRRAGAGIKSMVAATAFDDLLRGRAAQPSPRPPGGAAGGEL